MKISKYHLLGCGCCIVISEVKVPYIKPELRADLDAGLEKPMAPGELNYMLTKLCLDYLARCGGINYVTINEVIGALECCKLEMYRRVAVPYEGKKLLENGDVYAG